jgi:Ca2+/Na+ antiporter
MAKNINRHKHRLTNGDNGAVARPSPTGSGIIASHHISHRIQASRHHVTPHSHHIGMVVGVMIMLLCIARGRSVIASHSGIASRAGGLRFISRGVIIMLLLLLLLFSLLPMLLFPPVVTLLLLLLLWVLGDAAVLLVAVTTGCRRPLESVLLQKMQKKYY